MAHRDTHRSIHAYLPADEAGELERLAQANERSTAAEVRLAVRAWITRHAATPAPRRPSRRHTEREGK